MGYEKIDIYLRNGKIVHLFNVLRYSLEREFAEFDLPGAKNTFLAKKDEIIYIDLYYKK